KVIGGGLSGCEAALQLADAGYSVELHEMRPVVPTPAHKTDGLAELVCSNSFKGLSRTSAHGLLKEELARYGSKLLPLAFDARVPAGERGASGHPCRPGRGPDAGSRPLDHPRDRSADLRIPGAGPVRARRRPGHTR